MRRWWCARISNETDASRTICIQKRTFFAGVTVFFAGAAFLKTALICNFVANTIFILYYMFCDDVCVCDNEERIRLSFFLSLSLLWGQKFPFKMMKGKSYLKKVYLSFPSQLLSVLFVSRGAFPPPIFQLLCQAWDERARVSQEMRLLYHTGKTDKRFAPFQNNFVVNIHTFLLLVFIQQCTKPNAYNTHKHVSFFFRNGEKFCSVCHFFFVFVFVGEIVREKEITSAPTWQPKTTRE